MTNRVDRRASLAILRARRVRHQEAVPIADPLWGIERPTRVQRLRLRPPEAIYLPVARASGRCASERSVAARQCETCERDEQRAFPLGIVPAILASRCGVGARHLCHLVCPAGAGGPHPSRLGDGRWLAQRCAMAAVPRLRARRRRYRRRASAAPAHGEHRPASGGIAADHPAAVVVRFTVVVGAAADRARLRHCVRDQRRGGYVVAAPAGRAAAPPTGPRAHRRRRRGVRDCGPRARRTAGHRGRGPAGRPRGLADIRVLGAHAAPNRPQRAGTAHRSHGERSTARGVRRRPMGVPRLPACQRSPSRLMPGLSDTQSSGSCSPLTFSARSTSRLSSSA